MDEGWSRLEITQNYAAGSDQDLKIDLGQQNLTNIFSRSTIVRLRNDPTRLTVEKVVTGDRGDRDKEFRFTLTLTDAAGQPLFGEYGGLMFDEKGVAETTLKDGERIVIEGLEPGTVFTVTETPEDDYDTTVTLNGGTPEVVNALTVTLPQGGTNIVFTNDCTLPAPATPAPATPAPATPAPTQSATAQSTAKPAEPTAAPVQDVVPATGDPAMPAVWAALCAVSALGMMLFIRRRTRRNDH